MIKGENVVPIFYAQLTYYVLLVGTFLVNEISNGQKALIPESIFQN